MILKNYWRWVDACFKYPFRTTTATVVDFGILDVNGDSAPLFVGTNSTSTATLAPVSDTRYFGNITCLLGTGDNEISDSDYSLTSDVTSSFTNLSTVFTSSTADGSYKKTINVSGLNSTASDIVLTEVGIKKTMYTSSSSPYGEAEVLLAIVKLSSSLTVKPNDSFTVTIEWNEV